MTLVYSVLSPSSYNTFVDPGFALIPGRDPGIQSARLSEIQSVHFALFAGRCDQDAELALAVCFGRRTLTICSSAVNENVG